MLIMYNLIRLLICQAATRHGKDPRTISFLDALQHILEAIPIMTADTPDRAGQKFEYLLTVIADCEIDRPRRPRLNPRVVKVKMSNPAIPDPQAVFAGLGVQAITRPEPDQLRLEVKDAESIVGELVTRVTAGHRLESVRMARPSLDDVFLHHTGRALRD